LATADPLGELVSLLARLPGIGERTATRLAFHVLATAPEYAHALGASVAAIHSRIRRCRVCGNYGAEERCAICLDPRRDGSLICCVARVPDLKAIEQSGSYRGRYHVLHGLLAPLEEVGPSQLPLDSLVRRVREEGVEEIIVATPLNVEGEATALYVAQTLAPLGVKVSRIASGVPHGGELEFTDRVTLGRALMGRRDVDEERR